ncbi:hypothetical protein RRG08_033283 [Elysia crispata]|uniref:Uncharacterized protein n=1 Tax=Elysia crispata TaxID=231223 RepID=A0AAE0XR76_9GAST|nr:hypothetical protein RRG08_033283 [Elysia crispata]
MGFKLYNGLKWFPPRPVCDGYSCSGVSYTWASRHPSRAVMMSHVLRSGVKTGKVSCGDIEDRRGIRSEPLAIPRPSGSGDVYVFVRSEFRAIISAASTVRYRALTTTLIHEPWGPSNRCVGKLRYTGLPAGRGRQLQQTQEDYGGSTNLPLISPTLL